MNDITQRRKAKEAAEKAKIEQEKRKQHYAAVLQKVEARLLRGDLDKYIAVGTIVDARNKEGETVYFLMLGNKITFSLALPYNSKINLRNFWHKKIGIVGKIIYDQDEEYPIALCEKVVVLSK